MFHFMRLPSPRARSSRVKTALLCYTIAALMVMGGFIYKSNLQTENYRRSVLNDYRSAFNNAANSVNVLDSAMQKCAVSGTTGMETENFIGAYGAAVGAKQSLGALPNSDRDFEKTAGFINQVGDYALALSKKTSRGIKLTDEEKQNIKKLADAASVMNNNIMELVSEVNDGSLTLRELDNLSRKAGSETAEAYSERVKYAEQEFPDMPTLIYDGPFSEHIKGLKPLSLEGKLDVPADEARKIAEKFSGINGLKDDGERGGALPVYTFSGSADGASVTVEVSKQGGAPVNMYTSHKAGPKTVSIKEAVNKAADFLSEHGYANMRESYRMITRGVATVNFEYVEKDVIVYPDLIKIEVALDTGKVIGFEAQGYTMHHHERSIPEIKTDETAAREKVSSDLKILSHEMAIIPTGGKNEAFCHEFKCENSEGTHFIVYINAETGEEQHILMLLENENGTLTI